VTDEKSIKERLIDGAKILGGMWKESPEKDRCSKGWSLYCDCDKDFCTGKRLWKSIAKLEGRDLENTDHPFGMIEVMKPSELDAARLTLTIQVGEDLIRVGINGQVPWKELQKIDDQSGLNSFMKVLAHFDASVEKE